MITRVTAWGLALIYAGIFGTVNRMAYWAPCIAQADNATNFAAPNDACQIAIGEATLSDAVFNAGLLPLIVAVGAMATARGKIPARIAVLTAMFVFLSGPIADPGFFWQEWVSAEVRPGNGVISSLATCVAGGAMILAQSIWAKDALSPRGASNSDHAGKHGRSTPMLPELE